MSRIDRLLFLCFFVSGASALVYEVVWLRWLVHLFGATTLAVSTILTAYMAGLALGSWLAGRWGAAVTRPLRAYGLLELSIGAYALVLPLLLRGVVPGLRLVGATEASSYAALSLGRFALAILVLALPTACMGATLPILARFATPRLPLLGGRVGRLYAVNTAGAVLGTAAAGLALLPALGTTLTNQVAVGLNVAVGVAAIAVGRRRVEPPVGGASPAEPAEALEPGARRAACAAVATGAVSRTQIGNTAPEPSAGTRISAALSRNWRTSRRSCRPPLQPKSCRNRCGSSGRSHTPARALVPIPSWTAPRASPGSPRRSTRRARR